MKTNAGSLKIISFANLNGDFIKFSEIFQKILDKSGEFDLVILIGHAFNIHKDFNQIRELEKFKMKFVILDQSEIGVVCKHKFGFENYEISDNVTILNRTGLYVYKDLRIAFINGKESQKFLSEDEKYKYTGFYFSREDVEYLTSGSIDNNLYDLQGSTKIDILLTNVIPSVILDEMRQ